MESVVALTSPAHQVDRLKVHILAAFFHDCRHEVREEAIAYATSHPDGKPIPTMASLFLPRTPPLPAVEHADPIAGARQDIPRLHDLYDSWARTAKVKIASHSSCMDVR